MGSEMKLERNTELHDVHSLPNIVYVSNAGAWDGRVMLYVCDKREMCTELWWSNLKEK